MKVKWFSLVRATQQSLADAGLLHAIPPLRPGIACTSTEKEDKEDEEEEEEEEEEEKEEDQEEKKGTSAADGRGREQGLP
ncbi:hypothetical protein NHX12_026117, partial [Muraenolepis orangiensis]